MKNKKSRSKFAQNRIDYIVYGNPKGAAQLVYDYGYEPPKNQHDLVKAIKILVRKKGRKVVKELIKIHPDKKAILKIQRGKEDNFCGACSSYSYQPEDNFCGVCGHSNYDGKGDKQSFIDQLIDLGVEELEQYYENIVDKANQTPEDKNLAEEVQMVWNELRIKKAEAKAEKAKTEEIKELKNQGSTINDLIKGKEALITLSLVFTAGVLVGLSPKIIAK